MIGIFRLILQSLYLYQLNDWLLKLENLPNLGFRTNFAHMQRGSQYNLFMKTRLRYYILDKHRSNFFVLTYIRFRTRVVFTRKSNVVKDYVADFIRLKDDSKPDLVNIYYDNAISPETYGDYFCVLMLARFLALSGQEISFNILNVKHAERWNYLTIQQQTRFVSDQVKLAEYLLPKEVQVVLTDSEANADAEGRELSTINLGHELLPDGSAFFDAAPYFLHCLIKKHNWKLPEKFLLRRESGEESTPYIAWHIRKGLYDQRRDSSVELVQQDFAQLSNLFSGHAIKIFSDKIGLEHTFLALTGSAEVRAFWKNDTHVLPQEATCFMEAIPEVLNAAFYFQRKGGGLGVVPIFSSNPYLHLCPDVTNFHGKRGNALVPWAKRNQIFHHTWGDIDNIPIDKLISHR